VAREAFDVVILGTGAAGLTAAIAASEDGEPIVGLYAAGNVMPRRSV
jgi:succinate dehydrogenase/fumarate reductase flavoprotein subunit